MRLKVVLAIAGILSLNSLNAQIKEGEQMIGGTISLQTSRTETEAPFSGTSKSISFSFTPQLGIGIKNNWIVAAGFGYNYTKQRNESSSKPTPRSKKSVSISEPMEPKKIATIAATVLAMIAVVGIWRFGLPFGGGAAETPLDPKATVAVLKMILKNFDDLSRTTDQSAIDECMANVKPQMAAILAKTQDPKNNTPEVAACQAATKALMKIADSLPDKQEDIEQGVTEFQKQIALVQ